MKNKVTSKNTIFLQTHRDSNLGLVSKPQERTHSKNSIRNKKTPSNQNEELLDRTQFRSNKNNKTIKTKVSIPSLTVNNITTAIDLRKDQYLSKTRKSPFRLI